MILPDKPKQFLPMKYTSHLKIHYEDFSVFTTGNSCCLAFHLFCFNMFLYNIWVKDSPTNTHFKAKLSGLAQRTPDTGNVSTIKITEDTYGNSNSISVDLFCLGDIF